MIYSESAYRVTYYLDPATGNSPVHDLLLKLPIKDRSKVMKYIEVLRQYQGVLDQPLSRHINGKIRELRVDFGCHRYRIFYFTFINQNIILLQAFQKSSSATPHREIVKAQQAYNNVINNRELYE